MQSVCRCNCSLKKLHTAKQVPPGYCHSSLHQAATAASKSTPPHTCSSSGRHSRQGSLTCHAFDPLFTLAGSDPAALQDVIVGGAVTAAVGAALYSGLKQEPVPCDLCAGNGGIKCFACSGAGSSMGSMDLIDPEILEAQAGRKLARGFTSRNSSKPGSCRVCKGKGLVLCSKCKGSGYISKF